MDNFKDRMFAMQLGERISSGDKGKYQFEWEITRVASGWIYSCPAGQGHSVFVPYDNHFIQPF